MSGPGTVVIKRKRNDQAPEALLVERPGKRQQQDVHYILQNLRPSPDSVVSTREDKYSPRSGTVGQERRIFRLTRQRTPEPGVQTLKRRRTARNNPTGLATFVEGHAERDAKEHMGLDVHETSAETLSPAPQVLKRPGRSAAVKITATRYEAGAPGDRSRGQASIETMANSLHEFALEQVAKEGLPKPKLTLMPKLPPQRSRELHRQHAAHSAASFQEQRADVNMGDDDEGDYVYDTYILAPTSEDGAAQANASGGFGNVGYLVITEEDQAAWEMYIEDEPSDKDWNSDEEDENAEDWYGADYPDDELASDDEFGHNAYGYRGNAGSDNEEYDQDTGTWSDEEYDRMHNPWSKKSPQQFPKYNDRVAQPDDVKE